MKDITRKERKEKFLKDLSEWLEKHNGEFPREYIVKDKTRLKKDELTPEESFETKLARKWKEHYTSVPEMYDDYVNMPIEEVPEEYREIVKAVKKMRNNPDKKVIKKVRKVLEWVRLKDGKFPKSYKDEKLADTPEKKEELQLYRIYRSQTMKELEEQYKDTPLEEIPETVREYFEVLRKSKIKTRFFKEMIEWLETHDGKHPLFSKRINGVRLNRKDMSEEQRKESRLHTNWADSEEKKILESYVGVELKDIPEEYRTYIKRMREFGYGLEDRTYEEIVSWLQVHNGTLPRGEITSPKSLKGLTEKQIEYETDLKKRWDKSEEKRVLNEYLGIPLKEIPEEFRDKIEVLRSYGLGLEEKEVDEEIFEWLKTHDGKLPVAEIRHESKKRTKKRGELTPEERREVRLRYNWNISTLKAILDGYAEMPIEEVPKDFREKVQILRDYGYGLKKKIEYDTFNEIIEWLKNNNGKYPRSIIIDENGNRKLADLFTPEESYEISLSHRWYRAEEKRVYDEYDEKDIQEVPEEFRDKVAILRKYKKDYLRPYKKDIFVWLEKHDGKLPRTAIYKDGERLKKENMTEEELEETRMYRSWKHSKLKSLLNQYAGQPLENIPEEFREDIQKLREYGHMGRQRKDQITKMMKKAVATNVGYNEQVRAELALEIGENEKRENELEQL